MRLPAGTPFVASQRPTLGPVGVVIGATIGETGTDFSALAGSILAPGIGAQGGTAADLLQSSRMRPIRAAIHQSRGHVGRTNTSWPAGCRDTVLGEMKAAIRLR